jgi:hypothetical protein
MRFPIRFDPAFRLLCNTLFLSPDEAHVDVADDLVTVKFSWAFRATFPRVSIASASLYPQRPLSRGVHGFAGRWLVNGAGDRVLDLRFEPAQHGHVVGWPVRLRQLLVSVDDPTALADALAPTPPRDRPLTP